MEELERLISGSRGDWQQYRALVVTELRRLDSCQTTILERLREVERREAILATKILILGCVAGFIPAIAAVLINNHLWR